MDAIEETDLDAQEGKGRGVKTRRRTNAKPVEAGKRSLNLRVGQDEYERLAVHALRRHTTISELVMELARAHLREFSIHRNATKAGE